MTMHDHDTIEDVRPEDEARRDGDVKRETPAEEALRKADERDPAGTEYDTPPKQWVKGTVVPKDTAPEDMTDAEYIQWMYDNHTPFWAIKRNMLVREAPVLTSIEPSTARIGQESFVLVVSGHGFVQDISKIVFAGQDEPTKLETNGTLTTGVDMSVWHGPDELEVRVRNDDKVSEPLMFTFTPAVDEESEIAKVRGEHDHDHNGDDDDNGEKKHKKAAKKK